MAHTKILLRQDVDDLGARGEIVRVRAGYAQLSAPAQAGGGSDHE